MAKVASKKPAKSEKVLKANARLAALKKKGKLGGSASGSTTASSNGPARRVSFKQPVATITYSDGSKSGKAKPAIKTIEKVKGKEREKVKTESKGKIGKKPALKEKVEAKEAAKVKDGKIHAEATKAEKRKAPQEVAPKHEKVKVPTRVDKAARDYDDELEGLRIGKKVKKEKEVEKSPSEPGLSDDTLEMGATSADEAEEDSSEEAREVDEGEGEEEEEMESDPDGEDESDEEDDGEVSEEEEHEPEGAEAEEEPEEPKKAEAKQKEKEAKGKAVEAAAGDGVAVAKKANSASAFA